MDKEVKILVDEYKEKLSQQGLEPALIDYLVSVSVNAFSQIKILSSFTKVKIDINIY